MTMSTQPNHIEPELRGVAFVVMGLWFTLFTTLLAIGWTHQSLVSMHSSHNSILGFNHFWMFFGVLVASFQCLFSPSKVTLMIFLLCFFWIEYSMTFTAPLFEGLVSTQLRAVFLARPHRMRREISAWLKGFLASKALWYSYVGHDTLLIRVICLRLGLRYNASEPFVYYSITGDTKQRRNIRVRCTWLSPALNANLFKEINL